MNYRTFKCPSCGYTAQVQGELYQDAGTGWFLQTKVCKHCQILFEDTAPVPESMEWQPNQWTQLVNSGLLEIESDQSTMGCLRCGRQSREVWRKESPTCPKCHGGMIQITHTLT